MTLVASLLFATALAASVGVIVLTMRNAIPRIAQIIEMEFAPAMQVERKIVFGEVKTRNRIAAEVLVFPMRAVTLAPVYKLAA